MHHLLHRTFFSVGEMDPETMSEMGLHKALISMNKFHKMFMPDNVVCVFDNPSWRKEYTASEKCISHKKYKANRRKNLTEKQIIQFEVFDQHIQYFKSIIKEKTGMLILERERLEADDIIAGFVEAYPDDTHIILTGDNDFLQLLKYDNVTVYDPIEDKAKNLSKYDFDADYFMFQKCFRGDTGDNVMSSYPRVRTEKIKKAYTDDFTLENLLQHTFTVEYFDDSGELVSKKYKTLDVYHENLLLMDLSCQPDDIKQLIHETVRQTKRSRYNMIEFMKFCNSVGLKNIAESLTGFTGLLLGKK